MSPGTSGEIPLLMTCHYPDLSSASDWLKQISLAVRPIRSTALIWVMTPHQYGISALVSKTTFRGEICGGVATCRLFQVQAKGSAEEQLYDNWQQNCSGLHFFFIIGYDSFCLCCFVISQKNVDEMQHQQNLPKPPMAKFVPFPHDQHSYYRVLNGLLTVKSKNINGYHLNLTPNINASVMIKIKGVNRRKKHSEKKNSIDTAIDNLNLYSDMSKSSLYFLYPVL